MILEKRLDIIIDTLNKEKKVSNRYLTEKLGISESTLRRDLSYLQDQGKIKRVHGGAILNIESNENDFIYNEKSHIEEKIIISKKASKLIGNAKFIFIDAGSTCHGLIDYLDQDMEITVVTNGLMHLERLISKNIPTILLEGMVKPSTRVVCGEKTLDAISKYNFDLTFVGANGYDDRAYYTADINEALVKERAIVNAARAYVLADTSKKAVKYFATIAFRKEAELITEE